MSDPQIREFKYPDDFPAAKLLWETAGPGIQLRRSDEPGEILKKLQRDPDLFLVAEIDGELIGTVIGGFDGRRGLIYHLAVAPQVRNKGIGSILMQEVESRLRSKGCIKSYLLVTTDNKEAMEYYKKHGWEHMDQVLVFGKEL